MNVNHINNLFKCNRTGHILKLASTNIHNWSFDDYTKLYKLSLDHNNENVFTYLLDHLTRTIDFYKCTDYNYSMESIIEQYAGVLYYRRCKNNIIKMNLFILKRLYRSYNKTIKLQHRRKYVKVCGNIDIIKYMTSDIIAHMITNIIVDTSIDKIKNKYYDYTNVNNIKYILSIQFRFSKGIRIAEYIDYSKVMDEELYKFIYAKIGYKHCMYVNN